MTMAVKKRFPFQSALVACGGGASRCTYGCTGCGACVSACRFEAIQLPERGPARVEEDRCIACGACVSACPQGIIRLHDCGNPIVVLCSNREKGALARERCGRSCIGCGLCQRSCGAGAVRVEHRAVIDESRCLSCGMCAVSCPRHAIRDLRGVLTAEE